MYNFVSDCGGTLIAEKGLFATPGYPDKYPSDIQCEWILQVSPGKKPLEYEVRALVIM